MVKPAVLHYETQHMTADEHEVVHAKLKALGYIVRVSDADSDDMAVLS